MSKKRCYISGPISRGDLAHNIRQAEAAFFALLKAGYAPFCPHWSCYSNGPAKNDVTGEVTAVATSQGGGGCTHGEWVDADLAWVEVSHAVIRLPGESKGADRECKLARECDIPVLHVKNAEPDTLQRLVKRLDRLSALGKMP